MAKISAAVINLDGTLATGRVAASIGKRYIRQEFRLAKDALRGGDMGMAFEHFRTTYRGVRGAAEVMRTVKKLGGTEGEMQGQRKFYDIMIANGLGIRREMFDFAGAHIRKHLIPDVANLVLGMRGKITTPLPFDILPGTPVFLVTTTGTTAAEYAVRAYDLSWPKSNIEVFSPANSEDGRLVEFIQVMKDGRDRAEYTSIILHESNISWSEVLVIGNDDFDVISMKMAGAVIASPCATPDVAELAKHHRNGIALQKADI